MPSHDNIKILNLIKIITFMFLGILCTFKMLTKTWKKYPNFKLTIDYSTIKRLINVLFLGC